MLREGRSHSVGVNPATGAREAIPRHSELKDQLARRIAQRLDVPPPPGQNAPGGRCPRHAPGTFAF
ncbi:MAG: hypothetical protein FIB00_05635 [Chloroflexi bacterium]|nr:hypothetical protein [Chloroflexota bacterium]PWB45315.1 MAG: hypothetical protein C3F10_08400 [Dehalococcoidia bacterium]